MTEDPVARRNRGGAGVGLWLLCGLGALVIVLVAASMLRPKPVIAPVEPAPAALSMKQRVAADAVARRQRDAARAEQRHS